MIRGAYRFSPLKNKNQEKLGKCGRCRIRKNCELLDDKVKRKLFNPKKEVPDYIMTARNNCVLHTLASFTFDQSVKYVGDGIQDHYKININKYSKSIESNTDKLWEPCQPVYILAGTGKGKNTFIEKTLFPYTKDVNRKYSIKKKVLVISNRKALQAQMKDRIEGGIYSKEYDQNSIFDYPEFSDIADVMLYQGILANQKRLEEKQQDIMSSYLFVVCDEAHFFTSDSSFNPEMERILDAIVKTFNNAIRIYMTATPYDCLKYIEDFESKGRYDNGIEPAPGVCYHFKRNYDFLDAKYYSDRDELLDLIIDSGKEKWLIFIDDKRACDKFKEKLEKAGMEEDEVMAVSAESKNISIYQKMIVEEHYVRKIRVVIATSVIDNSVNFRGVQNVVLSDVSRVKCIQMLGRARLADADSRITLYLKRFDETFMESRLQYLEKQRDAYHYYAAAYEQGAARPVDKVEFLNKYYDEQRIDQKPAKHWFGRDITNPEKVFPNSIARSMVEATIPIYKSISKEMKQNDHNREVPGREYLEHQLSWFGKTHVKDNDVTLVDTKELNRQKIEEGKKLLSDFLESYIGKQILADKKKDFRKEFTEEHDNIFQREEKNKNRIYGMDVINKILRTRNLPYYVSNKNRGFWEVIRIEDDPNKSYDESVRE